LASFYKILFAVLLCFGFAAGAKSQLTVTGTVYDSTKTIPIKDVTVKSSSGTFAITDSAGRYTIVTSDRDSLTFIYQGKPTAKFSVKQIPNIGGFDISLYVRVAEKFKTLKEVKVYAKNYRQDSIANREEYAKIFNYQKPTIRSSVDAGTGAAGADLNELINVFRFKRNRQLRKLQERLVEQEKETYVNYRFNKTTVRRITKLDGTDLEEFMKLYRPGFEFTQTSTVVEFYQYILNASYDFKLNKEKDNQVDYRFNKQTVSMISGLQDKELEEFMKKYRPTYDFALNSSADSFYQYILNGSIEFKKEKQPAAPPATDSLKTH